MGRWSGAGEDPGPQVGLGLLWGYYSVNQLIFALVQGHYLVNLNVVLFVDSQDHCQVEQVVLTAPEK